MLSRHRLLFKHFWTNRSLLPSAVDSYGAEIKVHKDMESGGYFRMQSVQSPDFNPIEHLCDELQQNSTNSPWANFYTLWNHFIYNTYDSKKSCWMIAWQSINPCWGRKTNKTHLKGSCLKIANICKSASRILSISVHLFCFVHISWCQLLG